MAKYLIVNADDFGSSKGINEGIIYCHNNGIVTATSVLVNRPLSKEAKDLPKLCPKLSLGLHFEVIQDFTDRKDLEIELQKQWDEFIKITGQEPDHLDSHSPSYKYPKIHFHETPFAKPVFKAFAKKHHLHLRNCSGTFFIRHFMGLDSITKKATLDRISVNNLINILTNLKEGTTELMCHPGYVTPDLISSLRKQREIELRTLTDERVKKKLEELKIKLVNFNYKK